MGGPLANQSDRSPGTALLLDFILPGAGHIYGSGGENGVGLLIANVLCAITVPFVYVTGVVNICIWVYAMTTAGAVTEAHNAAIRYAERDREEAMKAERDREEENRRRGQAEERLRVTGRELALEFNKLDGLRRMRILGDTEFNSQKKALLEGLVGKRTQDSLTDFFLPLGPLVEAKIVAEEDLADIKRIYGQISRP